MYNVKHIMGYIELVCANDTVPQHKFYLTLPPGNGVGDACEGDLDGDGVSNEVDICPENMHLQKADFQEFTSVLLSPETFNPTWTISNNVSLCVGSNWDALANF